MASDKKNAAASTHRGMAIGSLLRILNLLAGAAVALVLMPFMVHHLGDRVYGAWSLVIAYISYYNLLDFGLTSAISQYLCVALGKGDDAECREVFNTSLVIQTLIGLAALLATLALAPFAAHLLAGQVESATIWQVTLILGLNTALGFPARVYAGVLDAEYRFVAQSALNLLGVVLRSVLMVAAVYSNHGLVFLAWATLFASLPVLAVQTFLAHRSAPWARIDFAYARASRIRQLLSYSVFTFITTVADNLRYQIDPLLITAYVGLSAVTHYRVASALMAYSINVVIMTTGIVQPMLSRSYGEGNHQKLTRAFLFVSKISLLFAMLVCLLTILLGRAFVARWMGADYSDAYLPMAILALAVFLDVSQNPSIGLLYATFKNRYYTYMNAAEGVLNLIFSLMLVRHYGIVGVALGTLIAALLTRIFVQPWMVCKVTAIDFQLYLARTIRALGAGLLATLVVLVPGWWLARPSYAMLVADALLVTVFFGGITFLLALETSERDLLCNALGARIRRQ